MEPAALGLSFLAGALSTLSPCVAPLLPIVAGAAAAQHRAGPLALAAGLAISFTAIGLFVATFGFAIGLDGGVFRAAGGAVMVALGVVLSAPPLQQKFALAAGPVGVWAQERFGGFSEVGLGGQFGVGLLLGAVWSPCVGPTLGAASLLAARGENLGAVALAMSLFGLGAALPLAALGLATREAAPRLRARLTGAGGALKFALGALLIALGLAILTGADKALEAWLVAASPDWLTDLTTRF